MKGKVIIWYRNDLRIHDHEPLHKALENGYEPIFFYCFDNHYFGKTNYGFAKTAYHRTKFLVASVENLRQNLRKLGSDLVVRTGDTAEELAILAKENKVAHILAQKGIASEERAIEKRAIAACSLSKFTWFFDETLYHPNELPHSINDLPEVFTAFRKALEKKSKPRELLIAPTKLPAIPSHIDLGKIPSTSELCDEAPPVMQNVPFEALGGEDMALLRLQEYIWEKELLKTYKITRNGLLGMDYSSKFSPWLANGCLSPRKIYWEIKKYENEVMSNQSTYWLFFELIWRDFFKFYALKYGNSIFKVDGPKNIAAKYHSNKKFLNAWLTGTTGNPFVDANMRELNATGFMSNRGRQNAASFFVKDLGLDWRIGASYFESLLIDYDVSSNWGNWNYVAGVGADPRENRYFNTLKQAKQYDEGAKFMQFWIPEIQGLSADEVFDLFTTKRAVAGYPLPIVSVGL